MAVAARVLEPPQRRLFLFVRPGARKTVRGTRVPYTKLHNNTHFCKNLGVLIQQQLVLVCARKGWNKRRKRETTQRNTTTTGKTNSVEVLGNNKTAATRKRRARASDLRTKERVIALYRRNAL